MKGNLLKLFTLAMVAVCCFTAGCGSSGGTKPRAKELSGTIAANGSTSMEKVIGILSESFMSKHKAVKITYDATGSGTGIEAAAAGRCDIGLSSRDLKDKEKVMGLKSQTLARDGIAIIVNNEAKIKDLTLQQVSDIFAGKITDWKSIDGRSGVFACIGREAASGTRDGFESITKTKGKCKLTQELTSTGAVIEAVKNNPNAIGYASFAAINVRSGVKVLTVEGVSCTPENIANGSYKVQRPFNLIMAEGKELSPQSKAFVEFMFSAEAADLIKKAGAVPLVK
ncbi:MAG: phosphate ABC transporter substrate-binding protein [Selenomonadaceae bacterium]|nr:phosphate ABC transporter substrate-binding protein [Selenomonadaceae bacterium]